MFLTVLYFALAAVEFRSGGFLQGDFALVPNKVCKGKPYTLLGRRQRERREREPYFFLPCVACVLDARDGGAALKVA